MHDFHSKLNDNYENQFKIHDFHSKLNDNYENQFKMHDFHSKLNDNYENQKTEDKGCCVNSICVQ
ncbi:hypothetical protein OUZ56_009215 [Daphnia magna]|uniref:Uncharacterized protein n=1 Tax=Daphnia magna TaxID=35525 RepID=A0ABR0AFD9_9CRUS|nr:hypothetical protein OUZ56_009215 [Daphnia magna]